MQTFIRNLRAHTKEVLDPVLEIRYQKRTLLRNGHVEGRIQNVNRSVDLLDHRIQMMIHTSNARADKQKLRRLKLQQVATLSQVLQK